MAADPTLRKLRPLIVVFLLQACECGEEIPDPDGGRCIPSDCSDRGLNCGTILDDTGQCLLCGACELPLSCGGGGELNVCGCTPQTCEEQELECGTADDGCGLSIECGTCTDPGESCGGAGLPNICGLVLEHNSPCEGRSESCLPGGYLCCDVVGSMRCVRPKDGECPGPLPDLIIDKARFISTIYVETATIPAGACELQECLDTPGVRRLLRFGTLTMNLGPGDWELGTGETNPAFEYFECRDDFQFPDYLDFRLLDGTGNEVRRGTKLAFCITDAERFDSSSPTEPVYDCGEGFKQGIQVGWADFYEAELSCQWLDITGVSPGEYTVEQTVNPERLIDETDYDNNVVTIPFTIPPP